MRDTAPDAAPIVTDIRRAIELLVAADDPAATKTADALTRWLAGEASFDGAAGLSPGWRRGLQQATRDAALEALIRLNPELNDQALGQRIAYGIAGAKDGIRPDGELGHYHDLARNDRDTAARTWRRLVGKLRGQLSDSVAMRAFSVWSTSKLER